MKLLIQINKKELREYLPFANSFLIGLKNYSVNYYELSLDEIKEMLNTYPNIELFVSINKNIFNDDLKDLEKKLIELSKLNIKGVLFYDLSILSITQRLNLKINLCFHQTHMVTNYNICNFYKDLGCSYAYLSTEITKEEMEDISLKTNISLISYFIGHVIISHSKRKLVTNYYQHIERSNHNKINTIKEKNKDREYLVVENKIGTNILTGDILNGSRAFLDLKDKIEYGIIDNNYIDDNIFLQILELYKKSLEEKIDGELFLKDMEKLIGNYDGFFYTKTIYKVK